MAPNVSVVMSVHNGERYLAEAVESILHQTFTDFEFIIVDDGSTDRTWQILARYAARDPRLVLVRNEENIGLTRSLNKGLAAAKGAYIARQDADDVSAPERLEAQSAYLQRHAHVGLLGTAYHVIDAEGHSTSTQQQPLTDTEIRWQMLFHNAFCHSSVMVRQGIFDGGETLYNEELPYSQDYDLWARLLTRTYAANLEAPLVAFRTHGASLEATCRMPQQQIASQIAAQQIGALLPQRRLTQSEIETLRHWYYGFPERLSDQHIALCDALLQLFGAFEKQQNLDAHILWSLRRRLIHRILAAVPFEQPRELWASGLFGSLLRRDALSVVTHISRYAIRRAGRVLGLS